MIEFTQTNLVPGSCWQTAVACILNRDPATLPDQATLDADNKWRFRNALSAYLDKHHQLMYSDVYDYVFPVLQMRDPGYHMLQGPTIRTPENHREHIVVARYGEMVWDPHPSRAGLTEVKMWGVLCPMPPRIKEWRDKRLAEGDKDLECICPACAKPWSSFGRDPRTAELTAQDVELLNRDDHTDTDIEF